MALTADQKSAVRYYMGYSASGSGTALFDYRELGYSQVSHMGISLDGTTDQPNGGRLNNLNSWEESRITSYFLVNLPLREAEVQSAAANLDTERAAVWTHNPAEIAQRTALYTDLRLELCRFLGFPPGSGLQASSNRLVRA